MPRFEPIPNNPQSWLDRRHPVFKAMADRWSVTHLTYTGDLLDPKLIGQFLIRRAIGESDDAYRERQRLADYTSHFGTVVDTLAGLLFANEEDATRVFRTEDNEGLGELSTPDTPIANLWLDVDGEGTGWLTAHKRLAIDLVVYQQMWGIVTAPDGVPRLNHLPPLQVLNWTEPSPGQVTEALVLDLSDHGDSIQAEIEEESPRFLYYTTSGWSTWTMNEKREAVEIVEEGSAGSYHFSDRWDRPVCPLFRARIPIRRYVGWLLATKQNAIFNLENARDYLQWIGSFPKLNLVGNDAAFTKLQTGLQRGSNVLQDDPAITKSHHYIAPPTENARQLSETLKRKVEEFYVTAFREYSDSAIERTATEIRQDTAAGVGAFLQLLKAALDDAENQALGRIAQVLFPTEPERWWIARVERSTEVVPLDTQMLIDRLMARTYGANKIVPWGRTAQIDAAMEIARYDGRRVNAEEIESAVDFETMLKGLDALREVMDILPDVAKATLAAKTLRALNALPLLTEEEDLDVAEARFIQEAIAEAADRRNEARAAATLQAELANTPDTMHTASMTTETEST